MSEGFYMFYMNPFLETILTKEFILDRVSQEDILEKYLSIPVIFNKLQKSGIRKDPKPSASFQRKTDGSIIYRDFGDDSIKGDCFNVVCNKYHCSFQDALKIIAKDFKLLDINISKNEIIRVYKPEILKDPEERVIVPIQIKRKEWTKKGLDFWLKYGITKDILDFYNVCMISHYWYNKQIRFVSDCTFAYYFKSYEYKIYSPYEEVYRFITNTNCLQGYNQLPDKGDLLIYTKSLKDIMLFFKYNIAATATQAEGNMLFEKDFKELNNRFDRSLLFYDFDYAGIRGSGQIKRRFDIPRIALSNGRYGTTNYGSKDLSDYYEANGDKKTRELINKIKQYNV